MGNIGFLPWKGYFSTAQLISRTFETSCPHHFPIIIVKNPLISFNISPLNPFQPVLHTEEYFLT